MIKYWKIAVIAIAASVAILVGTALIVSGGKGNHALCQEKAEAAMRQVIEDVKTGRDTPKRDPAPECLKLPVKERAAIMADVLKKYGEEWSQAIVDSSK